MTHDEFATLLPPRGDAWLKVQAVADGPGGIHLDLDVDDVHAAAAEAERLGATRVGGIGEVVVILRSPGGLTFCLTPWHGDAEQVRDGRGRARRPGLPRLPRRRARRRGRLLDGTDRLEWADVDEPELSGCGGRPDIPFRLLFQRLGEPTGAVRAHVDVACADRGSSLGRHLAAGAKVVRVREGWTVMADPVGRVYCLTDRSPTAPPG